jgi:hypothetical protein
MFQRVQFHAPLLSYGAAMSEQRPWIVIAMVAVYLPPNFSASSVSCPASEQWRSGL